MHRFLLRLPSKLFEQVQNLAEEKNVSVNQLISSALEQPSNENCITVDDTTIELNQIRKLYGTSLIGILLYGSQIRGQATPDSDIDLLMVLSSESTIERKLYRHWDDAEIFPSKISPSFSKIPSLESISQVGSLWRELALDAKVLWEKDLTLSQSLSKLRKQLLSSNSKRKTAHGQGYWILKGT